MRMDKVAGESSGGGGRRGAEAHVGPPLAQQEARRQRREHRRGRHSPDQRAPARHQDAFRPTIRNGGTTNGIVTASAPSEPASRKNKPGSVRTEPIVVRSSFAATSVSLTTGPGRAAAPAF